jgi:alkylation response protein AidB-like acyl-CoA dehydrogenase
MQADSELEVLRESFRDVLTDASDSGDVRRHFNSGDGRCEALWSKAADLGWFALLTPEEHGGLGLGRTAAAVLYEELGRVAAPLPMLGALLGAEVLAHFGEEHQKQTWLPRLAAGEIAAFGADGLGQEANALRLADERVTGDALELLDGAEASLLIAPARQGGDVRWVLAELAGLSPQRDILVDRTRGLARARLDAVAASPLLGDAGAIGCAVRTHACIAIACDSIGGAKAVLELTIAYLKTREQFGKPIGSFQALKHRCAEHKVAIEAADALVAEAVSRWSRDDDGAELYALLAKSNACDAYAGVATDAVQLHGGIGFTWEHVCHFYLKRAKLNQILFGSGAAHRDAAAQLLVTRGRAR